MTLRLLRSSAGLDPARLRPGHDLVLDVEPEHALALAEGVAVEDHLDQSRRVAADRAGWASLAAWRAARGGELIVDGADLGHVAEVELLARCFLPAQRLRSALEAIGPPGDIEARGFDAAALRALHELTPASCRVSGTPAPPPPAPARAGRVPPLVRAAHRAGIPPWVRGEILCVPYWHLTEVYGRLAARRRRPRPVPVGLGLAGLPPATVAAILVRGGWGGSVAAADGARAAARVAAHLDRLAAGGGLDAWARDVLLRVAGTAPAELAHARRVLRGRARLVVTPFDSSEHQRPLLLAARERGVPTLVVQHGFDAELGDPDRTLADWVAVWSERDALELRARARGMVVRTGNPGADHLAPGGWGPGARGRTVVLVEYPGRLSARVGQRVGLRHVATALEALGRARPGTVAVIRPHPADAHAGSYPRALAGLAAGLDLRFDRTTPIESLLRSADLCIGALSTATLQSAAGGRGTIFLDVSGAERPWPFDGGPDALPRVRDADALVALIPDVLGASAPPGGAAAREALGGTGASTEAVLDLIDSLLAG